MSFSGSVDEVVYIIASIKIDIGQDMDSCQHYYDLLDYNKGSWWVCNDKK